MAQQHRHDRRIGGRQLRGQLGLAGGTGRRQGCFQRGELLPGQAAGVVAGGNRRDQFCRWLQQRLRKKNFQPFLPAVVGTDAQPEGVRVVCHCLWFLLLSPLPRGDATYSVWRLKRVW